MKDVLILPDIHGRSFWREAVKNLSPDDHAIFLGDYADPYPHEGISPEEAWINLLDIIVFAKEHAPRVTMLLGNHDFHYIFQSYQEKAMSSRFCHYMESDFHRVFTNHLSLFCLSWECQVNSKQVLFTHAGVNEGWFKYNEKTIGELNASHLNQLLHSAEGINALAQIGYERGGRYQYGSMVWADINEMETCKPFPHIYQVFGHTQQRHSPVITPHWACLDCRQAFWLSDIVK